MSEKKRTRFSAFVTKYLFTKGIVAVTVEDCFNTAPEMVANTTQAQIYYHKGDWHHTRALAVEKALFMIAAQRKSLAKKLKHLDALETSLRGRS